MGREIRRVPPNWEHPRNAGEYQPLMDQDFESAVEEWKAGYDAWENGTHPELKHGNGHEFWEWVGNPPDDRDMYRPKWDVEPTWYQVYETVSEGTPTTPPFETKEELAHYLSTYGDFAYQKGCHDISPKPTYEQALKFIEQGSVISMIIGPDGIKSTYETV